MKLIVKQMESRQSLANSAVTDSFPSIKSDHAMKALDLSATMAFQHSIVSLQGEYLVFCFGFVFLFGVVVGLLAVGATRYSPLFFGV